MPERLATMNEIAGFVTLMVAITGGGLLAWVRFYRDDKRAEEADTVNIVLQLYGQVERQQMRIEALHTNADQARTEAASTRAEVEQLTARIRRHEARFEMILGLVRPLVDWVDQGAAHPPPHVSDELRRLLHPDR